MRTLIIVIFFFGLSSCVKEEEVNTFVDKRCKDLLSIRCEDPAKPFLRQVSPLQCVAPYITIFIGDTARIHGRRLISHACDTTIDGGPCFVISESDFKKRNRMSIDIGRQPGDKKPFFVCKTGSATKPCPSTGGIYEISATEGRDFVITKVVNKSIEELKALSCFEPTVEKIPLGYCKKKGSDWKWDEVKQICNKIR